MKTVKKEDLQESQRWVEPVGQETWREIVSIGTNLLTYKVVTGQTFTVQIRTFQRWAQRFAALEPQPQKED